jgi:hypothetical protein
MKKTQVNNNFNLIEYESVCLVIAAFVFYHGNIIIACVLIIISLLICLSKLGQDYESTDKKEGKF